MSENTPETSPETSTETSTGTSTGTSTDPAQVADWTTLIADWLDWKATGAALGVSVNKVRQLIREHQLVAIVPSPGAGQQVPADLVMDGEIVKGVPGLLTMFADGGWSDHEVVQWLFTPDETLPGRPIDALRENRGSEVKRRAQAAAL